MRRVVVKLGSGTTADEAGDVREDVLAAVCDAARDAHGRGVEVVLVSSGAIVRGVRALGLAERPTAIEELQAASAVGQGRLFRVWDELLAQRGLTGAQILLTLPDLADRTPYLNARRTIEALLRWGVVPVVNENDTTTTDEISFGDNDFLAAQVAILVGADRLVLLTEPEGLFTADPRHDPSARLIDEVTDFAALDAVQIGHQASHFGTGGMRSKVVAAEMAVAGGIPAVVCTGRRPEVIAAAVHGADVGTRFPVPPGARRFSSFKLWLRYAKPSRGRVLVDPGAARALREGGTSLLPVGVVGVEGAFEAGEAVDVVVGDGGAAVGKGLTALSADELRAVQGLKTSAVRERLPMAAEEAVHRDHFVLAP